MRIKFSKKINFKQELIRTKLCHKIKINNFNYNNKKSKEQQNNLIMIFNKKIKILKNLILKINLLEQILFKIVNFFLNYKIKIYNNSNFNKIFFKLNNILNKILN